MRPDSVEKSSIGERIQGGLSMCRLMLDSPTVYLLRRTLYPQAGTGHPLDLPPLEMIVSGLHSPKEACTCSTGSIRGILDSGHVCEPLKSECAARVYNNESGMSKRADVGDS